jgi:hypothetical protein
MLILKSIKLNTIKDFANHVCMFILWNFFFGIWIDVFQEQYLIKVFLKV